LGTKARHLTNNAARRLCVLTLAGVVIAVFAHPAAALDSVVFQANWLIQGENAYMVAGRDKGFYREEDIDLDIKRGFGSGDTVKKVVGRRHRRHGRGDAGDRAREAAGQMHQRRIFLLAAVGTNILPKIMITFLVAFFPLVIATSAGLSATPRELIELGRSLQATRLKELVRIRLPFAIPFVFSGLKMAITFSVIGAVVGEFVAADRGLGYLMTSSLAFFNTPLGYGAIVILSLLAILLFQSVVVLERVLFPWSVRMRT
jgi:hypothetical protein